MRSLNFHAEEKIDLESITRQVEELPWENICTSGDIGMKLFTEAGQLRSAHSLGVKMGLANPISFPLKPKLTLPSK